MKKILLAVAFITMHTPLLAAMNLQATVNGMVCAFCAQGIEKRISNMPETKAVFVDLKNKVVVIEPKEGATLNAASIAAEIKDSGYDVIKMEAISKSIAEFRAEVVRKK